MIIYLGNFILLSLGYLFSLSRTLTHAHMLHRWVNNLALGLSTVVLGIIVVFIPYWLYKKHRKRQAIRATCISQSQDQLESTLFSYIVSNRPEEADVALSVLETYPNFNINQVDRTGTYVHLAARLNAPKILRVLCAHSADPNARDGSGGRPLHVAAGSGQVAVVRALMKAGAEVDARNKKGWTSLHWAASNGYCVYILCIYCVFSVSKYMMC